MLTQCLNLLEHFFISEEHLLQWPNGNYSSILMKKVVLTFSFSFSLQRWRRLFLQVLGPRSCWCRRSSRICMVRSRVQEDC